MCYTGEVATMLLNLSRFRISKSPSPKLGACSQENDNEDQPTLIIPRTRSCQLHHRDLRSPRGRPPQVRMAELGTPRSDLLDPRRLYLGRQDSVVLLWQDRGPEGVKSGSKSGLGRSVPLKG